jgi:CheY-like chemotaxis protein/HPt (histidine-containing phosphotransfer) domain-containing protein
MRPTLMDGAYPALAELQRAARAGEPFALVLLDCHMPGMDGLALARELRQQPASAGATVLMLLSSDPSIAAAECRDLGIAGCMTKPIRQSDLLDAMLRALEPVRAPVERIPSEEPRPALVGRRLRILLAEDNPINQKLALRLLEGQGQEVVLARNGREALAAVARETFDLALMDVQMPEVDGFEATAAIRERERGTGRHLPIIALTAHAMKGDRERCLEAGMDGYLAKPIQVRELVQALRELAAGLPAFAPAPPGEATAPGTTFDEAAALAQMGGSEKLLRELAGLFREEGPRLRDEARAAIDQGDAVRLRRAAHTLKGCALNFAAAAVVEEAQRMEALGAKNDLSAAAAAYPALAEEIHRLEQALANLAPLPASA